MKVLIQYRFTEEYFPTPRDKETKEREVVGSTFVNIKEVNKEDAPIVMVVKCKACDDAEIRTFKGKLYRNVQWIRSWPDDVLWDMNQTLGTMDWQFYLWGSSRRNACTERHVLGDSYTKTSIKNKARRLLIIDGKVFEQTSEPVYDVSLYDGKRYIMYIKYRDRFSQQEGCFSALEREVCHEYLKRILAFEGQEEDNYLDNNIEVLAPEYVKFKRKVGK